MDDREKVANILYEMFDTSFSRPWDALPEHVRKHWLENTDELVERLTEILPHD